MSEIQNFIYIFLDVYTEKEIMEKEMKENINVVARYDKCKLKSFNVEIKHLQVSFQNQ